MIGDWFLWLHVRPKELMEIAKKTGWELKNIFKEENGQYAAALQAT